MTQRWMILGMMLAMAAPTMVGAQDSASTDTTVAQSDTQTVTPTTDTAVAPVSEPAPASQVAPPPAPAADPVLTAQPATAEEPQTAKETEKVETNGESKIYQKRINRKLYLEFNTGRTRFDMTKFKDIEFLPRDLMTGEKRDFDYKDTGVMIGGELGIQSGFFMFGIKATNSKLSAFNLNTAGMNFTFLIRVPYIHPFIRFGLHYAWLKKQNLEEAFGDDVTLEDDPLATLADDMNSKKIRGGAVTLGAGIRVPIIKWISLAGGVDAMAVALYRDGALSAETIGSGENPAGGTIGLAWQTTFAITFHVL